MRKAFFVALLTLTLAATAAATPCVVGTVVSELGGAAQGPCVVPGSTLTLSNFQINDTFGNIADAQVSFTGFSVVGNWVYVNFGTLLGHPTENHDIALRFDVSSSGLPINMVDLANTGTPGSSIQETVCSGSVDIHGICTQGVQLANIVAFGGGGTVFSAEFQDSWAISVWKDIGAPAGNAISAFTQSYHLVPEPATFVLMGTGFLALGLLARRRRAKK